MSFNHVIFHEYLVISVAKMPNIRSKSCEKSIAVACMYSEQSQHYRPSVQSEVYTQHMAHKAIGMDYHMMTSYIKETSMQVKQ